MKSKIISLALRSPTAIIILATSVNVWSQVDVRVPPYQSSLEKETLSHWQEMQTFPDGLLSAFLAAEGVADRTEVLNFERKFNEFIGDVGRKVQPKYSVKKKGKELYKLLHKNILGKYVEIADLKTVLEDGEYNCLTATFLYYLLLQKYQVPVELYATPVHVYLALKDDRRDIYVDLTYVDAGYDVRKDINKTISLLLDLKLITRDEVAEQGEEAIYRDFVEKVRTFEPERFVAYQYNNLAVRAIQKEEFENACNAIHKATWIAPNDTTIVSTYRTAIALMTLHLENNWDRYLPCIHRAMLFFKDDSELTQACVDAFGLAVQYFTLHKRDFDKAEQILADLESNPPTDSLAVAKMKGVRRTFALALIESYIHGGQLEKGFEQASKLYRQDSLDTRVKEIYAVSSCSFAEYLAKRGQPVRAKEIVKPLLLSHENNAFVRDTYIATETLIIAQNNTIQYKPGKALAKLLELWKVAPNHFYLKTMICGAYHFLAMDEVRKEDYAAAKRQVLKGLKYNPEDNDLKDDLRLIEEQIKEMSLEQ